MFYITYQKRNGEIFNRVRNTLPNETVGEYTSMGWLILDIKRAYKNNYYSISDYHKLSSKKYHKEHKIRIIKKFLKEYATPIMLLILIILYLLN